MHKRGIVIDAVGVDDGFVVVREEFAAEASQPSVYVFDAHRGEGGTPVARWVWLPARPALVEVPPTGDPATAGVDCWAPDHAVDYPEIRSQAAVLAAARLRPR